MITAKHLDALLDAGATAEQIVALVKADMEDAEAKAVARRAKDAERQRRRRSRGVTRTERDPPKNIHTPCSVSDETDGEPSDPVAQMFDMGVAMLKSQGHDERKARSIVGSWRKGRSPGDVVAGLIDAKTRSITNLVEWMPKRLSGTRQTGPPDFMEHYEREMQRRTIASPA